MRFMKRFTSITLFSIICQLGWSQLTIKGSVFDNNNESIPFANVLVLDKQDSSLIKGDITNLDGNFEFSYNAQKPVILSIRFVGYQNYDVELPVSQSNVDFGKIIMNEGSYSLSEVTVTAQKALFEKKVDRTVINVQSSVTSAGNTALNVLGKSPTVSVNRANGEISLMGKQGVLVMINDKEVRMEPEDLLNMLEGMPADNIQSIELITTPPARYDAQGTAGIININMIENKNDGFTGRASANAGYADNPKYGGTLNLNYKKGRLQGYANLSANIDRGIQILNLYTNYQYPGNRVITDMYSNRDTYTGLYSGEAGLSYDLGSKTKFGAMFNIYNRDWEMDAYTDTDISSERDGDFNQFVVSNEVNNMLRTLYNVNLQHSFSDKLQWNIDYDFINFNRDNPTYYTATNTIEPDGVKTEESFYSSAETPLNIHVVKTDFEIKQSEKFTIETGAKVSFSGFENNVVVSNLENEEYIEDPGFSQIYIMDEQIYAGYASFNWEIIPSLLFKGGLRYEYYTLNLDSDSEGNLLDDEEGNIFPTAFLQYKQDENQEWRFTYAQRVQRPGFMQLAPYFYFFNETSLFTGNPRLSPAHSSQLQLAYRYKVLNVAIEYTHTKDPIFSWQPNAEMEREISVFAPIQGEASNLYSISASVPWNIGEKWESDYYFIAYYRDQTPIVQEVPVNKTSTNFVITMNHTYKLTDKWNVELNASYNSAYYEGLAKVDANPNVNMGVQRKFDNGAAITFNVTDIFDTSSQFPVGASLPGAGGSYKFKYDVEGPVFRLNVSVPLGKRSIDQKNSRSSGSAEELQRL